MAHAVRSGSISQMDETEALALIRDIRGSRRLAFKRNGKKKLPKAPAGIDWRELVRIFNGGV